jgi:hypothetical protein
MVSFQMSLVFAISNNLFILTESKKLAVTAGV